MASKKIPQATPVSVSDPATPSAPAAEAIAPVTAAPSPPPVASSPAPTPPPAAATPITGVANGSNGGTKIQLQSSYLALIAGLLAYYQPDDVFALPGGDMTRDELVAAFQAFVAECEATKAKNQAWREQVQVERASEQTVRPLRSGVKLIVQGKFGKSGVPLVKFGFPPAKVPAKNTTVKSAAVAKAEATREARGTKGSVQRKKVKGDVTGVVITPVTAGPPVQQPATSEPAAADAPSPAAPGAPSLATPPRS